MDTLHGIPALRAALQQARADGQRIGLVPTMGNLHAGHRHLVEVAAEACDLVVVSIFVNPLQFGAGEDFDSYPRTLPADQQALAGLPVLVFAPGAKDIYPAGPPATVVRVQGLGDVLCGTARPGHFDGVATVVCKLLNIVQPDEAWFGEKDFQQLVVLRTMAADLNLPCTITGVATQRAEDGLALSSRNSYLTPAERQRAPALQHNLQAVAAGVAAGGDSAALCRIAVDNLLAAGFAQPDYLTVRRRRDLAEATSADRELVVLAAARLGNARLIDNVPVDRPAKGTP